MTCARCGGADEPGLIADSTGETAIVCLGCATAWLREVVTDWDTSLRVFLGTATPAQRRAHERHLRAAAADDEAQAQRADERREKAAKAARTKAEKAKAKEAARVAAAEALREQRAAAVGRFVASRGGPVKTAAVAAALKLSPRTLSRVIPIAVERGFVVVKPGVGGGIASGPVSVP